ncbi:MAG TPA: hypothetical protein VHX11_09205 [Acidobacteriaceae bacterium]|jgi:hypothetical protein|nr:hypothetical protein [Acidobacteriaceae bacterium]
MSRNVLHLEIGRLIVDGLPGSAKHQFVRALEAELASLAHDLDPHVFAQGARKLRSIDAGRMRSPADAAQAAAQVASAIRSQLIGKGGNRRA